MSLTNSVTALQAYDEGLAAFRAGDNTQAVIEVRKGHRGRPQLRHGFFETGGDLCQLRYDDKAEQASRRAVELSENSPPGPLSAFEANQRAAS